MSPLQEAPSWDQSTLQLPRAQALTNLSPEGKARDGGGAGGARVPEAWGPYPGEWAQGVGETTHSGRPFRDWAPVVLTKAFQIKNQKSLEGSLGRPRGQQGWGRGNGLPRGGEGWGAPEKVC